MRKKSKKQLPLMPDASDHPQAAELENISRQSQVARMVESRGLGLEEAVEPPLKISVAGKRKRHENH